MQARNALARKGIIATEGEIRRWKAEQAAELQAAEAKIAFEAVQVAVTEAEASVVEGQMAPFEGQMVQGAVMEAIKASAVAEAEAAGTVVVAEAAEAAKSSQE
jgi:hypothetical protein